MKMPTFKSVKMLFVLVTVSVLIFIMIIDHNITAHTESFVHDDASKNLSLFNVLPAPARIGFPDTIIYDTPKFDAIDNKEFSGSEKVNDQEQDIIGCVPKSTDIFIVGAGLSGAVIAEHYARIHKLRAVIIDKRSHIGGNTPRRGEFFQSVAKAVVLTFWDG
jgi:hypothetical protein